MADVDAPKVEQEASVEPDLPEEEEEEEDEGGAGGPD
eukprot:CAMPEP_0171198232 /NCGR_PEP_ID=MMETSP0790-20130122/22825_1 /TAXON_ID=2925 /ORGANISM="Alexandrium catenella, Strain OF101" /LENGTH=36 /DNA_ID= /DNA_START= /DNA_END= /DNA_ORIENTATION=